MSAARRLRRQKERAPRGMVRCETHGLQPKVAVCSHAKDGIGSLKLQGGARGERYVFCPACSVTEKFDYEDCQKCVEEELNLSLDEPAS